MVLKEIAREFLEETSFEFNSRLKRKRLACFCSLRREQRGYRFFDLWIFYVLPQADIHMHVFILNI